jgi:hypothetical protein
VGEKLDLKPHPKTVSETWSRFPEGRERDRSEGCLFGDLNIEEGLDAAQMESLGGVTDEIVAENEVLDSG